MKSLILTISIVAMSLYNTGYVNMIEEQVVQPIREEKADFFTLRNGVQYIYKGKDKEMVEIVSDLIDQLPSELTMGVGEIHFEGKNGDTAGTACGSKIVLHDFESYSKNMQKHILYHEVAHTLGNAMQFYRILDRNYTDYTEYAKKDKNYLTDYSKDVIKREGNYSEDFADALAEYIMNNNSFKRKYKNRYEYIENLINQAKIIQNEGSKYD